MNRYNDWQGLLKMANEDLDKFGYSLLIVEPEEGFYNCEIRKDGNLVETYAENYYEDELSDLITDAWHDTKLKLV
jgi:hypothetical protein